MIKVRMAVMVSILFFSLGIVAFGLELPLVLCLIACAFLLFLCAPFFRLKRRLFLCILVFLLGFGYGFLRFSLDFNQAKPWLGASCTVTGIVEACTPHASGSYGLTVKTISINGTPCRFRLYASVPDSENIGDTVSFSAKLNRSQKARNAGEFDQRRWLMSKGVYVTASVQKVTVFHRAKFSVLRLPLYARGFIRRVLDGFTDKDAHAFACAIFLGQKDAMSDDFRACLSKTGLSHTVAISGMHISFVLVFLLFLFRVRSERSRWLYIPVLFCLLFFIQMVGAPVSAIRAGIMTAYVLIGRCVKRSISPLYSLFVAAMLLLLYRPFWLFDTGFILSFTAVLGLLLFAFPLAARFPRLQSRKLFQIIVASICAQALMVPFLMHLFGQLPLLGILGNCVLLPALPLYMLFGFICIVLSLCFPFASTFLLALPEKFSYLIVLFVRFLSSVPACAIPCGRPLIFFSLAWLLCLLALVLRPAQKRFFKTVVFLVVIGMLWALVSFFSLRITAFDVGHGDCFLVQRKNTAVMVDCGSGNTDSPSFDAASLLQKRWIFSLDALYLSHYDKDHCNAAHALIASGKVKHLYLPKFPVEHNEKARLLKDAARYSVPVSQISEGFCLSHGALSCRVLASGDAEAFDDATNDQSLLLSMTAGHRRLLFTGDTETERLDELSENPFISPCDFLKIPHHGLKSALSPTFLNACSPRYAIISAAQSDNITDSFYTLERLGCQVRSTGENGAVSLIALPIGQFFFSPSF